MLAVLTDNDQLKALCDDIRRMIIEILSLAANPALRLGLNLTPL